MTESAFDRVSRLANDAADRHALGIGPEDPLYAPLEPDKPVRPYPLRNVLRPGPDRSVKPGVGREVWNGALWGIALMVVAEIVALCGYWIWEIVR